MKSRESWPRLPWRCAFVGICFFFISLDSLLAQPTAKVVLGRWARGLRVGRDMDARGVKLYGSEFVDQDLRNARFDHCALYGVELVECNLTNSFFRGAVLGGASISSCRLDHADFTDAIINDMADPYVRFTPQQLVSTYSYKKKDLGNAMISGPPSDERGEPLDYDFRRTDLSRASLFGGDFTKSDFTDSTLFGAEFSLCVLAFESLSSSRTFRSRNLQEMTFAGVYFVDACDFSGMDLRRARLLRLSNHARPGPLPLNLTDALIQGATFANDPVSVPTVTGKHLRSTASYRQGDLSGIRLYDVDLAGVDLSNQNLTKAAFGHCDLTNVDFTGAVITGADFVTFRYRRDPTKGLTADQIKSTWNYKHGRMEGIRLPPEIAQALRSEKE
jgi:uncharacterized protein YjbI with pentapeptide repeats